MPSKWIEVPHKIFGVIQWNDTICSNCRKEALANECGGYYLTLYCPHCGAIMQNPNEGE